MSGGRGQFLSPAWLKYMRFLVCWDLSPLVQSMFSPIIDNNMINKFESSFLLTSTPLQTVWSKRPWMSSFVFLSSDHFKWINVILPWWYLVLSYSFRNHIMIQTNNLLLHHLPTLLPLFSYSLYLLFIWWYYGVLFLSLVCFLVMFFLGYFLYWTIVQKLRL